MRAAQLVGAQPVGAADYRVLHKTDTRRFLVYGPLAQSSADTATDGFTPYTTRADGSMNRWRISECKKAEFYGLTPIEGEVNHDYHPVVVVEGQLQCTNLLDQKEAPFSIKASKVLPFARSGQDAELRIKEIGTAYLRSISRVFEVASEKTS